MLMRGDIMSSIADIRGVLTVMNIDIKMTPNIETLTTTVGNLISSTCAITLSAPSLELLEEGAQISSQGATQSDMRTSRTANDIDSQGATQSDMRTSRTAMRCHS